MAELKTVIFYTSIATLSVLLCYSGFQKNQNRKEVYKWADTNGLSKHKDAIYSAGFSSLARCAGFVAKEHQVWSDGKSSEDNPEVSLVLPNSLPKAFSKQFEEAVSVLKEELILKQWLTESGLQSLYHRLVLEIHSLDDAVFVNYENLWLVESGYAAKWRKAVDELSHQSSLVSLKQALWKKYVLNCSNLEWNLGGIVVFTVFVVVVVSLFTMTQQMVTIRNRLLKRSFFEYLTGKYLVPQNCKVHFNWEEPCIVGRVMSLTVKFYQRNGQPYPICNKDSILVEVTHDNVKVATSTEVGSPDPSLANTMLVKFAVRKAGEYKIAAMVGNSHVRGSPFSKHFLPGPPDPQKTGFVHHCSTVVCSVGDVERLIVESRDEYNNHCLFQPGFDPNEGYLVKIEKIGLNEPLSTCYCLEYDHRHRRTILHLSMEKEGCYKANVTYHNVTVRNGDFNIIVLTKGDADAVSKNVSKSNTNIYYEMRLLAVNGEPLSKPKKVYCYLSPKQLTIKEFILKFIPKRLFTFRLCPSTKFQFQSGFNEAECPQMIIDDGCQPSIEVASAEANVVVACFTRYLLKNIGGSETFKDKRDFFYHEVRKLHSKRYHEKLSIRVQRRDLLHSSMKTVKSFSTTEWCKNFEIYFMGEQGLDWGGPRREWFDLLCRSLFDTQNQLFFRFKDDKQGLVHPNPDRPAELKLKYFEFAGNIVGKCLYESSLGSNYRQLVKARFTRSFLAQLIGLRVHYKYFEHDDPDLYMSKIRYIIENSVDDMDMYFAEEVYEDGRLVEVIDLIPNGSKTVVTNQNKLQYLDALAQHRLANPIKEELESFLRGLNNLIPDNLLGMFDENELELLICGTGQFSVADFRANHNVSGSSYEFRKVLDWFWTAVTNFTEEEMARLLQFTTGCSQLPAGGFTELTPKIQIIAAPTFGNLPTAHTCFNQLCLPDYESYEQFEKALVLAINEGSEGFGLV